MTDVTDKTAPDTNADPAVRPIARRSRANFQLRSRERITDMDQVLSTREVELITGRHRCTLYRWVLAGRFPKKHSSGGRSNGWLRSDVTKWLAGDHFPDQ